MQINDKLVNSIDNVREYNNNFKTANGRQPTACVVNFGCQQNVSDSEALKGFLNQMGYALISQEHLSDVVIFNTCAVRENAENTVLGHVGALKKVKALNPNMIIGICGCMTQQKHISDHIHESYPYVNLLFGSDAMNTLPSLLEELLKEGGRVFSVGAPTAEMAEDLPFHRENDIRAFVPIMSGCNNFCSYCIVPYVRGRERSRDYNLILKEVTKLLKEGFKEITLLGQNVNSYGCTEKNSPDFSQLLDEIATISGDFRIRFMTAHPKDCSKKLLDTMARHEKIGKHLHLPVQSGSNRILQQMNRGYTRENYLELIAYAREVMPEISFTSDIIIGFPGETDEDFNETLSLVKQVGYSAIFTFAYSPRTGTKAAELENNLSKEEKKSRFDAILELQREMSNQHNRFLVGGTYRVLVEETRRSNEEYLIGRFENNTLAVFKGEKNLIDSFVNVKITNYQDSLVEGIIVD